MAEYTTNDIVERLRVLDASNCMDSDHLHEGLVVDAADEIERLRAELAAMREQRDEARREICEAWAKQDGLPFDWKGLRGAEGMAQFLGWDCYEEGGGA